MLSFIKGIHGFDSFLDYGEKLKRRVMSNVYLKMEYCIIGEMLQIFSAILPRSMARIS